ncbi:hypothetical protein V8G54_011490 [Vigna mungo]|uniref:Uncharacterized protein n=1 Tax=Vigna mungo TaxID=3915 RepID=A0AAQ3S340_VIGMU
MQTCACYLTCYIQTFHIGLSLETSLNSSTHVMSSRNYWDWMASYVQTMQETRRRNVGKMGENFLLGLVTYIKKNILLTTLFQLVIYASGHNIPWSKLCPLIIKGHESFHI